MLKKFVSKFIVFVFLFLSTNKGYAGWCSSANRQSAIDHLNYMNNVHPGYFSCSLSGSGGSYLGTPAFHITGSCLGSNSHGYFTVYFDSYAATGCRSSAVVAKNSPVIESPSCKKGSIIYSANQVLGEIIPITGASFNLNYFSNRVKGRLSDYILHIPISAEIVLPDVTGYNLVIKNDLGGTVHSASFGTATNQSTTYTTNGINGSNQEPWATVKYTVEIEEASPTAANTSIARVQAGSLKNIKLAVGGWVPSIWYFYEPTSKTLYNPDGTEKTIVAKNLTGGFYQVPNEDGSLVYIFDSTGKIIETKLGLTGQVIYSFYYDGSERLSYINEPFNKTTTFDRNGSGVLTSITTSNGKVTTVTHDPNGYLTSITNPNSEMHEMTYDGAGGLLLTFKKPNRALSEFIYDSNGNLIKDKHSGGKEINLSKTTSIDGSFKITSVTGMSRPDIMTVIPADTYSKQEEVRADGSKYISESTSNISRVHSYNDSSETINYTPDTIRFGGASNFISNRTDSKWGRRITTLNNQITLTDLNDPFSINTWTKTSKIGYQSQYPVTSTYTGSDKKTVTTTSLGKTTETIIDSYQRPTSVQQGSLNPVVMSYVDDKLSEITHGNRVTRFSYNVSNLLSVITNALGQKTKFTYNLAERLSRTILPDGREVRYTYDKVGNIRSITPPSRPAHFLYQNKKELLSRYTPPVLLDVLIPSTYYYYNLDKQLTKIQRPDGKTIQYVYDELSGRLNTMQIASGDYNFTYGRLNEKVSLPTSITSPNGSRVDLGYSYGVLNQTTVRSPLNQIVYTYYADAVEHAHLNSETISGLTGSFITNYIYDNDEYLSKAGDLVLSYNTPNGQLVGATLGVLSESMIYNLFGELSNFQFRQSGALKYRLILTRDKLSRVIKKVETLNGINATYEYTYDLAGRLIEVKKDTVVISSYVYDANSNRVGGNNGSTITATYDDQDRMIRYQNNIFTYNANGDLTSATNTSTAQITTYDYDVFGNLKKVVLPTKTITYEIDTLNRRLGRSDGATSVSYAYDNSNRLIAEINNTGALTRRYVYATKAHVPDYFYNQANEKFKIVSDNLGSVRLVVKESDGTIQQRMEHDEFGKVITDTNPGYQPFGFAGGIYDHETGLVRFGARDYMPSAGRWTSKDPILFDGEDTNLFGYVWNDPVNLVDPEGLTGDSPRGPQRIESGGGGGAATAGIGPGSVSIRSVGPITGYTRHGLNGAISREGVGTSPRAILDAVRNPVSTRNFSGGVTEYRGIDAGVRLNSDGKVITTFPLNGNGYRCGQ